MEESKTRKETNRNDNTVWNQSGRKRLKLRQIHVVQNKTIKQGITVKTNQIVKLSIQNRVTKLTKAPVTNYNCITLK